MGRNRGQFRKM